MTLKLYGDFLSQPVRAVALFCLANNIDYELVFVDLSKSEHRKPEFLAISPRGQVPTIDDDGFKLAESATILRYLAMSRSVPDHWYPADLKAKAHVDFLLDWYQTNLRQTSSYVVQKELLPLLWKLPQGNDATIKPIEERMDAAFNLLEKAFLNIEQGPYLLGGSQPTIADLLLACEYTQTYFLTKADQERLLGSKVKTKRWLEALEKSLAPHYAEVHQRNLKLVEILEASRNDANQSRT